MSTTASNDEHVGIALIASIPMVALQVVWGGFVIMKLWGWFIVTTFAGAPQLGLAEAIGVDLVVSMFTLRRVATSYKKEGLWQMMFLSLFHTLFTGALLLFIGFIVKGL